MEETDDNSSTHELEPDDSISDVSEFDESSFDEVVPPFDEAKWKLENIRNVVDLLVRNDSTQSYGEVHFDDNAAFPIGEALKRNTTLKTMDLLLLPELTLNGAQALVNGWKQSQVTQLAIKVERGGPSSDVLTFILQEAIQIMQDIRIIFSFSDDEAIAIGASLHGNTHLTNLELSIGSNLTYSGAQQLALGFPSSKLQCLTLLKAFDAKNFFDQIPNAQIRVLLVQAVKFVQKLVLHVGDQSPMNDEDAKVLGEALVGNSTLETLEIVVQMTSRGASLLADGIRRSQIVCLHLWHCRWAPFPDEIMQVLYDGARDAPALQNLFTAPPGMRSTAALATCLPHLQSLTVTSDEMDIPTFSQGLRSASRLSILKIFSQQFHLTARDMMILSSGMSCLSSLTALTIGGNLTCEEGDAVHAEISYRRFSFRSSDVANVRGTAAEQLMLSVSNLPNFVHLDLSHCYDIKCMGQTMLGLQLPNVRFKELVLERLFVLMPLDMKQDDRIRLNACAGQAFVIGLRTNFYLKVLTCNCIDPLQRVEVDFYLQLNKSGRYLLHLENGAAPGLWCHVLAKCRLLCDLPTKIGVMYYFLREQPMLLSAAAMIRSI
jgi:hypothetical protein